MADKCLNLFDEWAAQYVHLCIQEEECISSSWGGRKMYTPGKRTNSQTAPAKINEIGAIVKVKILAEKVILWGI